MEKKIEKIEGAYDLPVIKKKLNQVIDYLNSESRPEGNYKLTIEDLEDITKLITYVMGELSKAREQVLLELLEKKTNYKIERVDHGYKVTQEYVLVSDIEKELSKLSKKK